MSSKMRVSERPVGVVVMRQMLIADFLTSPMLARGSRAPVFSAIHFFSLLMMSSRSFLSADRRHVLLQVLFVGAIVQRFARLRMELLSSPFSDRTIELDVRCIELWPRPA